MIEIDPQIDPIPEEDGYEFSYYAFDVLLPIGAHKINDDNDEEEVKDLQNVPLDINKLENLIQLQLNDPFCKNIMKQLNKNKLIERQPYFIEDYILNLNMLVTTGL